ncbi:MAG TPA: hypothetical protein VFU23_12310, partial [Gemmatimonadales bacterium]|nr:hypothetical protein [Gemmatimonadales bacterium]
MSVDTLLELLTREAEASARELVTAGEQRARSIDDAAEASARSRRGHELARLEAEARHAVACETAAAEQRLRRAGSEARAEVLRRIFAEAEALLAHAAAEYQSGLDALLETT